MLSDVDEIPNPEVIQKQIQQGVTEIYGLKTDMFMYFLNNKLIFDGGSNMTEEEAEQGIWHCTALLPYKLLVKKPHRIRKTIMRTKRRGVVYPIIPNAGWHFTYIGGAKKIVEKLESFSHTEYNFDEFKEIDKINDRIKTGKDLFGRDMKFKVVAVDQHMPSYLRTEDAQLKFKDLFVS
jgi:beta-1,4-mannosyl-glycoprotein beta-1,4-N-acetylglucosaminyltransferase